MYRHQHCGAAGVHCINKARKAEAKLGSLPSIPPLNSKSTLVNTWGIAHKPAHALIYCNMTNNIHTADHLRHLHSYPTIMGRRNQIRSSLDPH